MKITSFETCTVAMALEEPYTIAYETIDTAPNVFLKATTDNGLTGWGCAAPDLEVTGETDPCERMEEIQPGLFQALAPGWRGGVTCRNCSSMELIREGSSSKSAMAAS